MKIKSYKELDVWKKGIEIVDGVYKMTEKFPKEERYGSANQMQRAAVSIASNIAEGFTRQHTKEYQQFCYIALGSCAELETQLIIAQRRNYVSSEDFSELEDYLDHESRMLMNLIKSLRGYRVTNHDTRNTKKCSKEKAMNATLPHSEFHNPKSEIMRVLLIEDNRGTLR